MVGVAHVRMRVPQFVVVVLVGVRFPRGDARDMRVLVVFVVHVHVVMVEWHVHVEVFVAGAQ
jgi:hypothetical protein